MGNKSKAAPPKLSVEGNHCSAELIFSRGLCLPYGLAAWLAPDQSACGLREADHCSNPGERCSLLGLVETDCQGMFRNSFGGYISQAPVRESETRLVISNKGCSVWEVGYKSVGRAEGAAAERKACAWCAGPVPGRKLGCGEPGGRLHGAQLPPATVAACTAAVNTGRCLPSPTFPSPQRLPWAEASVGPRQHTDSQQGSNLATGQRWGWRERNRG